MLAKEVALAQVTMMRTLAQVTPVLHDNRIESVEGGLTTAGRTIVPALIAMAVIIVISEIDRKNLRMSKPKQRKNTTPETVVENTIRKDQVGIGEIAAAADIVLIQKT